MSGSRDRTIRLWDLRSNTTKQILKKHSNAVTCLSLNKGGAYLISGSADKSICIWRIKYSGQHGNKIDNIYLDKQITNAHDETVTCVISS